MIQPPSASPTTYTLAVSEDKNGSRLDKFLAEALPDLSRSRLKTLILDGRVSFGGCAGKEPVALRDPSYRVGGGQCFRVDVPPVRPAEPEAQAMDLNVVYEDEDLLVIDKPAGMVVHPAVGNPDRTLVNALLAHCGEGLKGIGGVGRPGIVHRLDKDTSGLMVVAKNDLAHQSLAAQFAAHSLERAYLALVWGVPSPREGEITGNIGRSPANRKKMAVVERGGKHALTRYRVIKSFGAIASLVECRLATGRTHQIRVHMTHVGHPLLGDPVYGGGRRRSRPLPQGVGEAVARLGRQALHAIVIGFRHPSSGKTLNFQSSLPSDIKELIYELERY